MVKLFLSADNSGTEIYDPLDAVKLRLDARAVNRYEVPGDGHHQRSDYWLDGGLEHAAVESSVSAANNPQTRAFDF